MPPFVQQRARGCEHTRQENFVFPGRTIRVPPRCKNNPRERRGDERDHHARFTSRIFTLLFYHAPSDESYCASQLLRLFFHSRPFPPLFFFYLCRLASKHAINPVSFSTNPRAFFFLLDVYISADGFSFPSSRRDQTRGTVRLPPLVGSHRFAHHAFTTFIHTRSRIDINHIRKHPIRKQYVHRFVNSIIFIGAHRETMYLCILLEGQFERPERARIRWQSLSFPSSSFLRT